MYHPRYHLRKPPMQAASLFLILLLLMAMRGDSKVVYSINHHALFASAARMFAS